jgi:hypothetical protein
VSEDTPKIPGNNDGGRKIAAFGGTTGVGGGRTCKRGTRDRRIEDWTEGKAEKMLTK